MYESKRPKNNRGLNHVHAGPGKLNGSHSVLVNLVILFYPCIVFSQNLLITELYRNPYGSESALCGGMSHEFIELTNFGTDTFFLSNIFLSDGNETDSVLPFGVAINGHDSCIIDQAYIAPGQTGLILDSDYKLAVEKQGCPLPIKNRTILLRCADTELGNGLSDDDGILLYRGSRNRIETIICLLSDSPLESESPTSGKITFSEPRNMEGYSVVATRLLTENKRFDNCVNGVSPGWLENVQRGWIVEYTFGNYVSSQAKVQCTLSCICINPDLQGNNANWLLEKSGSAIHHGSLLLEKNRAQLIISLPVDSVDYRFVISDTEWKIDMSAILLPRSPLKINEVFPFGTQFESEWFELFNVSTMSINLKGWKFGNFGDSSVIINREYLLAPGTFVVIAKSKQLLLNAYPDIAPVIEPQSWHALDNYGDTLYLFDTDGKIRDMVCYRYSWFANMNRAIEKVNSLSSGCDSANWVISTKGGTPSFPNDALFWRNTAKVGMEIGPVPFTPDHDGKDDLLSIKMTVPASSTIKLCIYDFKGRKVRSFEGPVQKQYFWDGKADNGKAVQCGPFFVVAELISKKGSTFLRKKGILWR